MPPRTGFATMYRARSSVGSASRKTRSYPYGCHNRFSNARAKQKPEYCVGLPFDEQMHVVGHEAVRSQRKPFLPCGSRDLRSRDIDSMRIDEVSSEAERAESKGVAVKSQVVERPQVFRSAWKHRSRMSKVQAEVRLKPGTT